jgi:hypothetical protein
MTDFLKPLYLYSGNVQLAIPANETPLNRNIWGSLYVSESGNVYAPISKPVTWIKFLGLSLSLPFVCAARKCQELYEGLFNPHTVDPSRYHSSQLLHLTQIAWKAVTGITSLNEGMENFSNAEIDYHQGTDASYLDHSRAHRFNKGHYIAICMQPLFHKAQYHPTHLLKDDIAALNKKGAYLEAVMQHKDPSRPSEWLKATINSVTMSRNPYRDFSFYEAADERERVRVSLADKEYLLNLALQCKKYAVRVITDQQPCFYLSSSDQGNCCEVQGEATCFDQRIWRQEKICGICYKIDCCATRCWAMNCCGFFCCIWPAANTHCCVI